MAPSNSISLDPRLSAIREMVGSCGNFADIGCDHGRLGADMLLRGLCGRAELADISEDSLKKARLLIRVLGLEERVRFSVGDGALALAARPDAAVIAGMGGQTIAGIVERGREILKDARLVLQPNVAAPELRLRLVGAGFRIADEDVVRDGRRLYTIIAAEAGEMNLSPLEAEIGPMLLKKRPGALEDFAAFRVRVAKKALAGALKGGREAAALKREAEIWEGFLRGDRS